VYTDDDTAGFTLQSLSLTAKDVMSNEILFNQFIYAFFDEVDKTDGSLLFDGSPAVEYGNTIVSDAIDNNIALGCLSVKGKHSETIISRVQTYITHIILC
jgi:hypothetical protein